MGKQDKKIDPAPTPLTTVIDKVRAYHTKMNRIAKFLEDNHAPADTRINKSQEYLEFYIDIAALDRMKDMTKPEECDGLAVYFGLTDFVTGNGITGCVLAVDKDKKILNQHFGVNLNSPVQAEDTWLPPGPTGAAYVPKANDFTIGTSLDDLMKHFVR